MAATGADAEMAPADVDSAQDSNTRDAENVLAEQGEVPTLDHRLRHMPFWDGIPWELLHDPIGIMNQIPTEVKPAVAELRAALAAAADDGNSAAMKAFFFLDRVLFAKLGRSRGGRRGQKGEGPSRAICRRLRSAWAGEWSALWEES